jgi:hypothetical protein
VDSIRSFSSAEGASPSRDIEDAPTGMRQELVDAVYRVADATGGQLSADNDLYFVVLQSLGNVAAGNPQAAEGKGSDAI